VIAPSDLKWPATTPSSVPELFDFQRRYFKQSWWPDWDRWLKERSSGTKAGPAKLGNRKYKPIEPPPGRSVKIRAAWAGM
jgi:polyhydroxyalkanoate synthase